MLVMSICIVVLVPKVNDYSNMYFPNVHII